MNDQEYARIIANNLRNVMYESGKTQAEVCADLGIKKTTMSNWMNGKRIPRMHNIDALCQYFGIQRENLLRPRSEQKKAYYLDPAVAQIAQEIFDDPDLRILMDAGRGANARDVRFAADMLRRLKETNADG